MGFPAVSKLKLALLLCAFGDQSGCRFETMSAETCLLYVLKTLKRFIGVRKTQRSFGLAHEYLQRFRDSVQSFANHFNPKLYRFDADVESYP